MIKLSSNKSALLTFTHNELPRLEPFGYGPRGPLTKQNLCRKRAKNKPILSRKKAPGVRSKSTFKFHAKTYSYRACDASRFIGSNPPSSVCSKFSSRIGNCLRAPPLNRKAPLSNHKRTKITNLTEPQFSAKLHAT